MNNRQIFFQHLGLPSSKAMALEVEKAEGIYLWSTSGRKYTDLVSGVAVSNIGHRHPDVIKAIDDQLSRYLHLMVYGKYIQSPQVRFAELLATNLPSSLNSVFFVNSGSEANEGALKLAKRFTGRAEIIAFRNAYHGGTQGALSVLGNESLKYAFRPLIPGTKFLEFNNQGQLVSITNKTAAVIAETIQAEAGIRIPDIDFLQALRRRCDETGTLLIIDDIQMGFGRTGKLFSFENYGIVPDILTLAKSMGGGMPLGAFISSKEIMLSLTSKPELGHITTFGGHPVCCAAAMASLKVLLKTSLIENAEKKGQQFVQALSGQKPIKKIRQKGLMIAVEMYSLEDTNRFVKIMFEHGLITDQFLFCPQAFRIAPPLTINNEEIRETINTLLFCLDKIKN